MQIVFFNRFHATLDPFPRFKITPIFPLGWQGIVLNERPGQHIEIKGEPEVCLVI